MLDCEIQLNSFRFAQSLCPPDSVIVSLKSLNGMQIVVSIGKSQVNHRLLSARNCALLWKVSALTLIMRPRLN